MAATRTSARAGNTLALKDGARSARVLELVAADVRADVQGLRAEAPEGTLDERLLDAGEGLVARIRASGLRFQRFAAGGSLLRSRHMPFQAATRYLTLFGRCRRSLAPLVGTQEQAAGWWKAVAAGLRRTRSSQPRSSGRHGPSATPAASSPTIWRLVGLSAFKNGHARRGRAPMPISVVAFDA